MEPPHEAPASDEAVTQEPSRLPGTSPTQPVLVPMLPGRYVAKEVIGRGGQAIVFRAHDAALDRDVAVKELLAEVPGDRDPAATRAARARFLREARITGWLEHPNVVPVHEIGSKPDGTLYCVQKLVRGRTLAQAIADCRTLADRLRLLPQFESACHAVAYAHSRGIVHRDLKPANVMIGEFGETVVLDWGIARILDGDPALDLAHATPEAAEGSTRLGDVVGTPGFMSPEQARGERADTRSDAFSLGAILYAMLAGEGLPSSATSGAPVVDAARVRQALRDVPPDLRAIVLRALARDPADRYEGAAELASDIEAFRAGRSVLAYEYSTWELLRRLVMRHRAASLVAATALVVLVVALAVIAVAWREARGNLALAYMERGERAEHDHDWAVAEAAYANALALGGSDGATWGLRMTRGRGPLPVSRFSPLDRTALALGAISPTGDLAAMLHVSGFVELHSTANGGLVERFDARGSVPRATAFDDAGRLLVITEAGEMLVREPSGEQESICLPIGAVPFAAALRATRGRIIVQDATGITWIDAASGRSMAHVAAPAGKVIATISGDGRRAGFVSGTSDGVDVIIHEPASGAAFRLHARHEREVDTIALSPRGSFLALASADTTISLWAVDSAIERARLRMSDGAPTSLAFDADESLLATGFADGFVILWDARAARSVARFLSGVRPAYGLTFVGDGSRLVTWHADGVRTWSLGPGDRPLVGHEPGHVRALAFSPDGRRLISGGQDGGLIAWDVSAASALVRRDAHREEIRDVAFSRDGARFASASMDGTIGLWDPATLAPIETLRGHSLGVSGVAFAPDGQLWSSSFDGTVRRWDAHGIETLRLEHPSGVGALALTTDGRTVVAACRSEGSVLAWDTASAHELWSSQLELGNVLDVAISPDGARVVAGTDGGAGVMLDARDGTRLAVLGHAHWLAEAAFAPDGATLATAGLDVLRLWDGRDAQVAVADRAGRPAVAVAWAPDGSLIAEGGIDGVVRLLPIADAPSRRDAVGDALARRQLRQVGMTFEDDAR